jgi:beta-xylosidase
VTALPRTPRHPSDFPDPYVLHDGPGRWVAYATCGDHLNVRVLTSNDLITWAGPFEGMPVIPSWSIADRLWSPSGAKIGESYVLWYSIHKRDSPRQCISVATAPSAEGPFVDTRGEPLIFVSDDIGSIDPSPFVDTDGTRYLVWKADVSTAKGSSGLWIQPMTPDGLGLVGEKTLILTLDAPWEGETVEAPSLLEVDGTYYLFYSGNGFNTPRYAVGYATASSPLGPFKKRTVTRPWFHTDGVVAGPGGQEWTTDDDGKLVMAYHGWEPDRVGYRQGGNRRLYVSNVEFEGGRPVMQTDAATGGRRWWPFGRRS